MKLWIILAQVLPPESTVDNVSVTLVDTCAFKKSLLTFHISAKLCTCRNASDSNTLVAEIHNADVALLVYACDLPDSLPRLRSFWLPFITQQKADLPIVVCANKVDLRSGDRCFCKPPPSP